MFSAKMKRFAAVLVLAALVELSYQAALGAEDCTITDFSQVQSATENCKDIVIEDLLVPGGQTLNLRLSPGTTIVVKGNITFEYFEWDGPLVQINGTNFTIRGEPGHVWDGQGQSYWDGQGEWGSTKPLFFNIMADGVSLFDTFFVLNTPRHTLVLSDSDRVTFTNWLIDDSAGDESVAPPNKFGHNTDGFDLWNSTNIVLQDSTVRSQDDCVAIRCGSNYLVDNFFCHGGHGLSLSVGFSNDSIKLNTLTNVVIRNSVLELGENAIHIKTHADGGEGLINNVTYEDIQFTGLTKYGINIQQNYRNLPANTPNDPTPKGNIPITNLHFLNVVGTVNDTAVPVYINCAEGACSDWEFDDVSVAGLKENDCNFDPEGFQC
ncbi:polygalacturonase-like [Cylas formicarius]|uniref:polygalacturonase-like n=1 Tax=Cylas formicarius TaxID=197179 RepID=UPI0029585D03|nr:polygalacturonase-like [Cylas formicarius]